MVVRGYENNRDEQVGGGQEILGHWKHSALMIDTCHHTFVQTHRRSNSKSNSVQSISRVRLFSTPWTAARQASLSITNSQSPQKPMSIESVMPSNHLTLCRPLLLLPSIFPSIRVFSNESGLRIWWPNYWTTARLTSNANYDFESRILHQSCSINCKRRSRLMLGVHHWGTNCRRKWVCRNSQHFPNLMFLQTYTRPKQINLTNIKQKNLGTSLVVQGLRQRASHAGGSGSVAGWGTKISHVTHLG